MLPHFRAIAVFKSMYRIKRRKEKQHAIFAVLYAGNAVIGGIIVGVWRGSE